MEKVFKVYINKCKVNGEEIGLCEIRYKDVHPTGAKKALLLEKALNGEIIKVEKQAENKLFYPVIMKVT